MFLKNFLFVILIITLFFSVQAEKTTTTTTTNSNPNVSEYDELMTLVEKDQQTQSQQSDQLALDLEKAGQDYVGDGLSSGSPIGGTLPVEAQNAMYYGTAIGFFSLIGTIFVCGFSISLIVTHLKKRKRELRKENAGDLYHAM